MPADRIMYVFFALIMCFYSQYDLISLILKYAHRLVIFEQKIVIKIKS